MEYWPLALLVTVLSFASGSIPFSWIITRAVAGVDLRTVGSGNPGATNASRILGRKWFLVVFLLDAAKGSIPALYFAGLPELSGDPAIRLGMACGLGAILGHVFCPWLGWKGGKGVATGAGVIAALAPLPALGALGVFLVVLAVSRYVSLASCAACVALGPLAFAFGSTNELAVFCVAVGAFVTWLHRPNLIRVLTRTEPKVFQKKESPPHA